MEMNEPGFKDGVTPKDFVLLVDYMTGNGELRRVLPVPALEKAGK
jgi:hypothetical protein